ncbi:hypothetical protein LCGC14_1830680 [marine sediment metagenome]|uniref:Uncharacterized protein n=1 Tax=marine sediment metagenome TaxID=412755 RepID=A0A0F9IVS2_9ZZZZ
MDKDVKNVKRASEAVGKFVAPEVTLANGDAVTVNKLGWKGFREMFSSISQIVQLYFEHNNAQEKSTEIAMGSFVIKNQLEIADEATESTVEQAKTDAQKAFQRLAEKIIDAPDIVEKLVDKCTGLNSDTQAELEFDDVLDLAYTALRINFIENKKVLGFFSAWTSAVSDSPKERKRSPKKAAVAE